MSDQVTAEQFHAYATTRAQEAAKAILSADSTPTWWSLAPLTLGFVSSTIGGDNVVAVAIKAARAALVAGEGPNAEGVTFDNRVIAEGGMTLLSQSASDVLMGRIGLSGLVELGDIALVRARLAAGKPGPFGVAALKIGT
tara:strand:+ start:283 stop:702 length:420 start_codon:yes stop_codon:yes gene_type:complete